MCMHACCLGAEHIKRPPKKIYIAEGGQFAVGVDLSIGYQGAGLVVLSPKVYGLSCGSCALGERSLLFQR